MTHWRTLWDKLWPDHKGVIEWEDPLDTPATATAPTPFDTVEDERLVGEWIELDSRPAPLEGMK